MGEIKGKFVNKKELIEWLKDFWAEEISLDYLDDVINDMAHEDTIEPVAKTDEMAEIEEYFNSCINYWISTGISRGAATVRTLWWDCAEIWNVGKSWTPAKIEFFNRYRRYEPYGALPERDCVEKGNA